MRRGVEVVVVDDDVVDDVVVVVGPNDLNGRNGELVTALAWRWLDGAARGMWRRVRGSFGGSILGPRFGITCC